MGAGWSLHYQLRDGTRTQMEALTEESEGEGGGRYQKQEQDARQPRMTLLIACC